PTTISARSHVLIVTSSSSSTVSLHTLYDTQPATDRLTLLPKQDSMHAVSAFAWQYLDPTRVSVRHNCSRSGPSNLTRLRQPLNQKPGGHSVPGAGHSLAPFGRLRRPGSSDTRSPRHTSSQESSRGTPRHARSNDHF